MKSTSINVDLSVVVGHNEVVEYLHEGRSYVEGKEGSEYAIKLRNNNPFRVKVVVSVDGVSVISGKPASEATEEAGYIMGAHETQTIKGYRLDNESVAAFKFVKSEQGYAKAEKGLSGTTGVIGVRVFKEKTYTPPPAPIVKEIHHHHHHKVIEPWYTTTITPWFSMGNVDTEYSCNNAPKGILRGASARCASNNASAGIPSAAAENSYCVTSSVVGDTVAANDNPFTIGSTFGAKTESKVVEVTFAIDCCLGLIELFYTSKDGLKKLGVDLTKTQKVVFPAAFPSKYATPPTDWRG